MATAFRYAQALSCRRIHVLAGNVPADADDAERDRRRRLFVRHLRQACEDAAEQGVTITIEPLNARDMPGYLLSTQADAHAIREAVGKPNLKVQFDCYHAQITEGDLTEKLRRWLPHVGHVQIAGVPGRHEPNVGEINYDWLFRVLEEQRYDGWIGCEYRPQTTTVAGLAWMYKLIDRRPAPAGTAAAH
jgi:hydroxypyruvate isomerase